MNAFSVNEQRFRDGCRVLEVTGELDLAVVGEMSAALEKIDPDVELVVIDLEGCEFIDSSGIAVILSAHRSFEESGRRLVVASPRDQVERILTVSGLTENGLVFADPDAALDG